MHILIINTSTNKCTW